jgi:hypothetical protein
MTIKFADQKIKEARQRIVALDRKLANELMFSPSTGIPRPTRRGPAGVAWRVG